MSGRYQRPRIGWKTWDHRQWRRATERVSWGDLHRGHSIWAGRKHRACPAIDPKCGDVWVRRQPMGLYLVATGSVENQEDRRASVEDKVRWELLQRWQYRAMKHCRIRQNRGVCRSNRNRWAKRPDCLDSEVMPIQRYKLDWPPLWFPQRSHLKVIDHRHSKIKMTHLLDCCPVAARFLTYRSDGRPI